jgi:hypothetical protein
MTIKMLGTMACNPQETAKVAEQLLPFSFSFTGIYGPSPA